jgi:hypothetical protein
MKTKRIQIFQEITSCRTCLFNQESYCSYHHSDVGNIQLFTDDDIRDFPAKCPLPDSEFPLTKYKFPNGYPSSTNNLVNSIILFLTQADYPEEYLIEMVNFALITAANLNRAKGATPIEDFKFDLLTFAKALYDWYEDNY